MLTLSTKNQWQIGGILLATLLLTRAPLTDHLLDASWAVFFLAGFYLRRAVVFGGLMALAVLIDYVAITQFSVSDFCVSSAYVALIPAYGALFAAGRWFASQYQGETLYSALKLVAALSVGFLACEVISSGSFYFFSDKFAQTTVAEFGARLWQYAPHGFMITALYIAMGAFIHVAVTVLNRQHAFGK